MKLMILIVCLTLVVVIPDQCEGNPSPIVLIPGIMGSQLEVKDNLLISNSENKICETRQNFKQLWIAKTRLTINSVCAKREMPLKYDPRTNIFEDNDEVKIKVPGFGGTSTVEYLSTGILSIKYFYTTVKYFVDRGYKRGETICAAPYDWRLAADELERRGYFHNLKRLIEGMYYTNNRAKVTLVVHSMGGIVSLYFLTGFKEIDQAWKDQYINAYVTLSAAWSGGAAALRSVISGTDSVINKFLWVDVINNYLVPITRTFESIPWLFPKPSVFGDEVLVATPSHQYTAGDYQALFSGISGYENGYRIFQHVRGINRNYPAPNVPTYCFYGVKVSTPLKFTYPKNFNGHTNTIGMTPKTKYGDGDGTVNIESSQVCHRWSSMHPHRHFEYKAYKGVNHMGIVKDRTVLQDIATIVGAPEKKSSGIFSWIKVDK